MSSREDVVDEFLVRGSTGLEATNITLFVLRFPVKDDDDDEGVVIDDDVNVEDVDDADEEEEEEEEEEEDGSG